MEPDMKRVRLMEDLTKEQRIRRAGLIIVRAEVKMLKEDCAEDGHAFLPMGVCRVCGHDKVTGLSRESRLKQ